MNESSNYIIGIFEYFRLNYLTYFQFLDSIAIKLLCKEYGFSSGYIINWRNFIHLNFASQHVSMLNCSSRMNYLSECKLKHIFKQ